MAIDQDAGEGWGRAEQTAEATRELRRAMRLYRENPGHTSDALGLLQGSYVDAVRAGFTPERIEALTGMSIAELQELVGPP